MNKFKNYLFYNYVENQKKYWCILINNGDIREIYIKKNNVFHAKILLIQKKKLTVKNKLIGEIYFWCFQ